ncbi:MAG: hypothetical protein JSV92_04330 [archaeon]|nr:MAG: hypothetical protein JSV92_04330 [archaeon]
MVRKIKMIPVRKTPEEITAISMKPYNQENNINIYTKNDGEAKKIIFDMAKENFMNAANLSIEYDQATGGGTRHLTMFHPCHDHPYSIERLNENGNFFASLAGGVDSFSILRHEPGESESEMVEHKIDGDIVRKIVLVDLRKYFDENKKSISQELKKINSLYKEDCGKAMVLFEKQINYEYQPFMGIKDIIVSKDLDKKTEELLSFSISTKFKNLLKLYEKLEQFDYKLNS